MIQTPVAMRSDIPGESLLATAPIRRGTLVKEAVPDKDGFIVSCHTYEDITPQPVAFVDGGYPVEQTTLAAVSHADVCRRERVINRAPAHPQHVHVVVQNALQVGKTELLRRAYGGGGLVRRFGDADAGWGRGCLGLGSSALVHSDFSDLEARTVANYVKQGDTADAIAEKFCEKFFDREGFSELHLTTSTGRRTNIDEVMRKDLAENSRIFFPAKVIDAIHGKVAPESTAHKEPTKDRLVPRNMLPEQNTPGSYVRGRAVTGWGVRGIEAGAIYRVESLPHNSELCVLKHINI